MTVSPRTRRRPFGALAGIAVVAVGAWTGAWFYIRGQITANIDETLGFLSQQGVVVTCPQRSVSGWPFRIAVHCEAPSVRIAARGVAIDLARLSVSGLVTQPHLYIAEATGPISLRQGQTAGEARWTSLRFSLALNETGLERFSLAASDFEGRSQVPGQPEQALRLAKADVQLMPAIAVDRALATAGAAAGTTAAIAPSTPDSAVSGAQDLRLAVTAERAEASVGGLQPVPVPVDLFVDAKTTGLAGLPFDPRALAAAGAGVDVVQARVGLGDLAFEGGGRLTVAEDGGIDGLLEVQPATGAPVPGVPQAPASLKAAVAGAMLMFGTTGPSRTGRSGSRLDVVVDNGVVRVGRLTLAKLRPLF